MNFKLIVAGTLGLTLITSAAVYADGHAISSRQGMMKNVGASMKIAGAMMKGKMPFDSIAAELAMRTMNSTAHGLQFVFPDGTQTGGDTEAAPAIWSDRAGFNAAAAKFATDTGAAATAATKGEGEFKAAFGMVASNCKGCHEKYRIKK